MSTKIDGLMFPVDFPVSFNGGNSYSGIKFPLKFPIAFVSSKSVGFTFPLKFPLNFVSNKSLGFTFPLRFPMQFDSGDENRFVIKVPIKFNAYTGIYNGTKKMPFYESAVGKITKTPFKEKAWWFPGLMIEENIISKQSADISISENIQSLIQADFEMLSTNKVKVDWYGDTVPSVIIMKKSDSDEIYINDGTYSWDANYAIVDISSEDYNIYLLGTQNSGSSAIYTVGNANDTVVVPEIGVSLNEKVYDLELDNMSVYHLTINY